MQFRNLLTAVTVFLLLTACNQPEKKEVKPDFLAANIDTTINPAEDFFLYANGGWIKKTPIPESESGWGIGNLVNEEIYDRKKKINENAVKENAAEGTTSQKIADFWISGMDTVDIEKQQLKPLQADMDKIEAIKSVNDLILLTAAFHNKGVDVLFGEYAGQDQKNSDVIAYQLGQAGLGMPNRDYYFNTDERTAGVRKAYQVYLNKTFQQMGSDSASAAK